MGICPPETLLFSSRTGTPLTANNVRRRLREVTDAAAIADVTPHRFRRTVATTIHEIGGLLLAAEMLGHTDPKVTLQHYIKPNETVNPATAQILDQRFGGLSVLGNTPQMNSRIPVRISDAFLHPS